MKNKNGFTLIELLVVIAIIAILAGMIRAGIKDYREKKAQAEAKVQQTQGGQNSKW